ncbi:hypothetical protein [Phormidesmis sp. 146-33]
MSQSPPKLGGWGAEADRNEARKLHRIHVTLQTTQKLKESDRRQFMAEVVKGLGIGGQTLAERELGWNRRTIRKGMQELPSGQPIEDGYARSGRKRIEIKLPNLLADMGAIVDPQAQTDPSFKSTRLLRTLSLLSSLLKQLYWVLLFTLRGRVNKG